jgi:hypothetical protein
MGWVICKTVSYLQGVSVSASINTLVAISVERCLAICYPLKWQMTSRACRVVLAIIWTFSLTITLPWAIFFGLQPLEEGSDVQVSSGVLKEGRWCFFLHITILVAITKLNASRSRKDSSPPFPRGCKSTVQC